MVTAFVLCKEEWKGIGRVHIECQVKTSVKSTPQPYFGQGESNVSHPGTFESAPVGWGYPEIQWPGHIHPSPPGKYDAVGWCLSMIAEM